MGSQIKRKIEKKNQEIKSELDQNEKEIMEGLNAVAPLGTITIANNVKTLTKQAKEVKKPSEKLQKAIKKANGEKPTLTKTNPVKSEKISNEIVENYKRKVKEVMDKISTDDFPKLDSIAEKFGVDSNKYSHLQNGLRKMNTVNSVIGAVARGLRKGILTEKEVKQIFKLK